jgi:fumarate reductase subunit D
MRKIKPSLEPILWLHFSGGGALAAMAMPVLIVLFGLAFPLGWIETPTHERLLSLLRNPIARVTGFVLCSLSLIHAAHRLRYTLYDGLQIKHLNEMVNTLGYGGAVVGSLWAAYVFFLKV